VMHEGSRRGMEMRLREGGIHDLTIDDLRFTSNDSLNPPRHRQHSGVCTRPADQL